MSKTTKARQRKKSATQSPTDARPRPPIICLSTQDYSDLWTRKQRFMNWFAERGHKVIYVETQWHWLTWLKRRRGNRQRLTQFLHRPREVRPNLLIATPPVLLPFHQMLLPIAIVNNIVLGLWLRWIAARAKVTDPIVYSYVPYSQVAIRILGARKVLYEKVDDLAAAKGLVRRETVERMEKRFLGACKLVIVTASRLKEKLRDLHPNVHVIPNACDVQHFQGANERRVAPKALEMIPTPRIGFVGMLAYWIDLDLIDYIAAHRPQWQLVFIGPVGVDVTRLRQHRNVHFLGRRAYEELPELMAGIDVFMNPYKRDDIAESCSPLKVFEYLASGRPVVSVPMPEIQRFTPHVRIAEHYVGFVRAIDELLALPPEERRRLQQTLRELVRDDTWQNRFEQTRRLIEETFAS